MASRRTSVADTGQGMLPGLGIEAPERGRKAPTAPRPAKSAEAEGSTAVIPADLIHLPDLSGPVSQRQLDEVIERLEPYLARAKRMQGNKLGALRSAAVRSKKRPSPAELAEFFKPRWQGAPVPEGAALKAAAHFEVDRRTISRWRAQDAAKGGSARS